MDPAQIPPIELMADPGHLQGVLLDGIVRASARAGKTLNRVRTAMGMYHLTRRESEQAATTMREAVDPVGSTAS